MIEEIKPGVFRDHNGNVATVEYWGSEDKAKTSLITLENCRHCSDCRNCSDCWYCWNCADCWNCVDCWNCRNCSDCWYCRYCLDCRNCDNKSDFLNH